MASKRTLVFVTMFFCLLELGFSGNPPAIKATGDAACRTLTAGYWSKGPNKDTWWHGVRARVTLWNITDVQPLSSSGAYIAAINQSPGLEMIAAGYHVNPSLYNGDDQKVHFFTYWTNTSDYSTGCYNTLCPGFVVAEGNNLNPGASFDPPLSTYDGEHREIELRIKKDERTGNWSLYREDLGGPIDGNMTLLGWWPGSLFKSLSDHAEIIQWTGVVSHRFPTESTPPMGSGQYPSYPTEMDSWQFYIPELNYSTPPMGSEQFNITELNYNAASFTDCFGFDANGNYYDGDYHPLSNTDEQSCYNVSQWYETKDRSRRHFFFGGEGYCQY